MALDETVMLMPGQSLDTFIPASIVDDNYYEEFYEKYVIRMEIPEQPLGSRIILSHDREEVIIQDNDGWFV